MFSYRKKRDLRYIFKKVPILFKYTQTDSFEKLVSSSSLVFKNPTIFNDPYDCYPGLIDFDHIPKKYRKYLIEKYKSQINPQIVNRVQKSSNSDMTLYFRDKAFPIELSKLAITCFSEKYDSLLMWSHYSNSHTGVCIGFDLQKLYFNLLEFYPALIKVKYSDRLLRTEYFRDTHEAISNCFRIKSKCWEYEKEIRILLMNLTLDSSKKIFIPFNKEAINRIYLGSTIDSETENRIRSLCSRDLPNTKIYKMRLEKNNFRLVTE
jgi:hypothetical protein